MLIGSLEQEYQPPCQGGIEGTTKESGLLDGFADDRRAGQVASECRNMRWCCIYPEDLKPFIYKY